MSKPNVYSYLDYRGFLRDAFQARKKSDKAFSFRVFAREAGIKSAAHLKLVMDGKRNVSLEMAEVFARVFGLGRAETRFFVSLVSMNQAKTAEARAHFYDDLSRHPRYREAKPIERQQYDYLNRWYHVFVRELVAREDFREDPEWIAAQIRPPITAAEAAEAIELLLELKLLRRARNGKLRQADALLTTGPEVRSLAARRFHANMLARAQEALDAVDPAEREVAGVAVRLTREQVRRLKQRMFEIRQEILSHDGVESGPTAVHHFALQLFPVTHFGGGSEDTPEDSHDD